VPTFAIATLFLAAVVHVSTILLVPVVAEADGWSRLERFAAADRFTEIPTLQENATAAAVPGLDPLFVNGACRVDLTRGPGAVALEGRDRFWSLALYDPSGTIVFSLNDRTAVEGRLDMLVVNAAQNAEIRQMQAADTDQTIVVEADSDELIALLRLFAPNPTAQAEARRILVAAKCVAEPIAAGAVPSGG
jgi:uncharacterized membrane protein